MSHVLTHGRIVCGTITTPDLAAALVDYRDVLGLQLIEQGRVPSDLADSWGCPASAGARTAVLRPASGAACTVRLVEQPMPAEFTPLRSFGWAAFELTVQDVFGWPQRLAGSGFAVIGPPRDIPGMPYFVAMQVQGRGGEILYLNEVRSDTPTADLPRAHSPIDPIFIAILATPDRAATLRWYIDRLALDDGGSFDIPYTMISRAFAMAPDSIHGLSLAQKGRLPILEIDSYPPAAVPRQSIAGMLPPGNAMLTLAVESLEACALSFIVPPKIRAGAPYGARRSATAFGDAGELVELVEIGGADNASL